MKTYSDASHKTKTVTLLLGEQDEHIIFASQTQPDVIDVLRATINTDGSYTPIADPLTFHSWGMFYRWVESVYHDPDPFDDQAL